MAKRRGINAKIHGTSAALSPICHRSEIAELDRAVDRGGGDDDALVIMRDERPRRFMIEALAHYR